MAASPPSISPPISLFKYNSDQFSLSWLTLQTFRYQCCFYAIFSMKKKCYPSIIDFPIVLFQERCTILLHFSGEKQDFLRPGISLALIFPPPCFTFEISHSQNNFQPPFYWLVFKYLLAHWQHSFKIKKYEMFCCNIFDRAYMFPEHSLFLAQVSPSPITKSLKLGFWAFSITAPFTLLAFVFQ